MAEACDCRSGSGAEQSQGCCCCLLSPSSSVGEGLGWCQISPSSSVALTGWDRYWRSGLSTKPHHFFGLPPTYSGIAHMDKNVVHTSAHTHSYSQHSTVLLTWDKQKNQANDKMPHINKRCILSPSNSAGPTPTMIIDIGRQEAWGNNDKMQITESNFSYGSHS